MTVFTYAQYFLVHLKIVGITLHVSNVKHSLAILNQYLKIGLQSSQHDFLGSSFACRSDLLQVL